MSREKQIEEMAKELQIDCEQREERDCFAISCSKCRAEYLYNAGYRKQGEGEWVERTKTTTNAKGMEARYTINFCSECGYEIGTIRYQHKFCPKCGAKMKNTKN